MKIDLIEIPFEQKEILRNLLEKSGYEFSQYNDGDLNDLGLIGHKWLDVFWLENGWHAYFIKVENKLAGYVLMTDVVDKLFNNNYQIWDLFIIYKYRRQGVGTYVMNEIFKKFKGRWQITRHKKNIAAKYFWDMMINKSAKEYKIYQNDEIKAMLPDIDLSKNVDLECIVFDV